MLVDIKLASDLSHESERGAGAAASCQSELRSLVDIAVETMGWQAVSISTLLDGEYQVLAGTGLSSLAGESFRALADRAVTSAAPVCSGGDGPDSPFCIAIPIGSSEPNSKAVLTLLDAQRSGMDEGDERAIEKLCSIAGSLIDSQTFQQLAAEKQSELQITLEYMDQGITVFDKDARLVFWNQRYIDVFGIDPAVVQKGVSLKTLVDSVSRANGFEGFGTADYFEMLGKLKAGLARGEIVEGGARSMDGKIISSIHRAIPGGGWVATHSDVTDRVLAQEKVEHASQHDGMTGLVNRTRFTSEFERLSSEDCRLVAMLVDIDHFKAVNDNYGHAAGDAVICSVAERLRSCVRESDVVARLGGDEFAVLLKLDKQADANQARTIAEKVLRRMREELLFKRTAIEFSVSIGAYEVVDGETNLERVLSRADFALYKAKEEGRATYQFFDQRAAEELQRSKQAQSLVVREPYADTLSVHFQPMVCLSSGHDYCCEALIRWSGASADHLTPSAIIQAAEESGAINSIGRWVLNEAMKAQKSWGGATRIAVNLSPRQLGRGELVDQVRDALTTWQLEPHSLELEVTETALFQNQQSIDELKRLKSMGVQVSLDGFGSGQSSLMLLQRFPFDKLKIDENFVDEVVENPVSRTIVSSVVDLAHKLGIETIASGVDSKDQFTVTKLMGCDMGQGDLLGAAMPADQIHQRLTGSQLVA